MITADIHTHSTFSEDGRSDIRDMVEAAISAGLQTYGISEHLNYEYERLHLKIDGEEPRPTDERAYFSAIRKLQREYKDRLFLLAGLEFGYDHDTRTQERYIRTAETYRPDFIINSTHVCLGRDCYFPDFFAGKSKEYAYNAYLYRVLESLDAAYPYDIVAHIGYCSRNATYPDPKLRYEEFADVLDEILKRIIRKGKILEVNTSSKTAGSPFLPDTDILTRYFQLGGRNVSFASDAHDVTRVGEKRGLVCDALKKIGFTDLTIPYKGKHILQPL